MSRDTMGDVLSSRPNYHGGDDSLVQESLNEIADRRYIVRPCNTGVATFAVGYEVYDRKERRCVGDSYTYRMYAEQHADDLEAARNDA